VYLFGWNEVRHGEAGEAMTSWTKGGWEIRVKACGQRCFPVVELWRGCIKVRERLTEAAKHAVCGEGVRGV
jgi:hypothetical protein